MKTYMLVCVSISKYLTSLRGGQAIREKEEKGMSGQNKDKVCVKGRERIKIILKFKMEK